MDDAQPVSKLEFFYSPTSPDGQRFALKVNGKTVKTSIYDWQLIPIARFADSDSFSCITLFGRLANLERYKQVIQNGGRVLNYHPAFVDTLLGLRLFQLDTLIINPWSTDLPKFNGTYLLGRGETVPNITENEVAYLEFSARTSEVRRSTRSYVISDHGRHVMFTTESGTLKLTGEPGYYFWRDDEQAERDFRSGETKTRIDREIQAEIGRLSPDMRRPGLKAWAITRIINALEEYQDQIGEEGHFLRRGENEIFLALLMTKDSRPAIFSRLTESQLLEKLSLIKQLTLALRPVEVSPASEQISRMTSELRDINPAVWNSGVAVMQYSAFFRYCKRINPAAWKRFVQQVRTVRTKPAVKTPTIIENWTEDGPAEP